MTFFGKLLVFLNLVLGIGAAVFSTSLYSHRPGWFEEIKEGGIDKGHRPVNFPQLAAEIDSQGKAAALANANWGMNAKALEAAEQVRAARYARMFGTKGTKGLLDFARDGNPAGAAFLNLTEDASSRLLLLDSKNVVNGPDGQPLKGTDTLLNQFVADSIESETQALLSKMLRAEQKTLGGEIVVVQNKIYKQQDIRDNLVVEASRLDAFEVNATEHRQTVTRRRQQLENRLAPFRSLEKK